MARMPQIPGIDYSQAPDSQIPRAELPPVDGGSRALSTAGDAVEGIADNVSKQIAAQQAVVDDANEKKQAIVDEVAATKDGLDFSVSMSKLAEGVKKANWETPEKAQDAFTEQARTAAETYLSTAPNDAVAMKTTKMNAETIAGLTEHLGTWSSLRATQQAKANLDQMVNDGSAVAEKQLSIGALSNYTESFLKLTEQSRQGVKGDADAEANATRQAFAKAWVTTHGKDDPLGTLALLKGGDNFVTKNLTEADRHSLEDKTEASLLGARNDMVVNGLKSGTGMAAKAYGLFKDGQLTPGTTYDLQREIEARKNMTEMSPLLKDDPTTRNRILNDLQQQSEVIQKLDKVARMGAQTSIDSKSSDVTAKLVSQTRALFGASGKMTSEDLSANMQLKHDAAVARASNMITDHDFRVISNHVAGSMDAAIEAESKGGVGIKAAIESHYGWLSARQEGDRALAQYMDADHGQFSFSKDEQNMAWIAFMGQMNTATEGGQQIDAKAAKQMAFSAAQFVQARKSQVVK